MTNPHKLQEIKVWLETKLKLLGWTAICSSSGGLGLWTAILIMLFNIYATNGADENNNKSIINSLL